MRFIHGKDHRPPPQILSILDQAQGRRHLQYRDYHFLAALPSQWNRAKFPVRGCLQFRRMSNLREETVCPNKP
jgi:hypothetical protein